MGDHRASIKIKMEFHGIKDSVELDINYFPGSSDGVDERVIEFFRSVYDRGIAKYDNMIADMYEKQAQDQIEEAERKQLAQLKKKYGEEGGE